MAFLGLLTELYGAQAAPQILERLDALLARHTKAPHRADARALDQRDALLITYADQFRAPGEAPLRTLDRFASAHLRGLVSGLHILPFYPYTSDDGFSVVDYRQVDPQAGTWADIHRLQERFVLMYDAVINHISASSEWFQSWLRNDPRREEYFISLPPETDLSRVVRPRALPLLTPFDTARGREWVWTTFSADQIDLNYANPDVLLEIIDVLLEYAGHGARFLRLDAIAYLWKIPGTACIHLPQTHAVIRLLRAVLDRAAPQVLLITETNVPHRDNISYFGDGRGEAQMVYNFALPPLALHAAATGQVSALREWAASLRRPGDRAAFFNFLASHDGIGLNPARGILAPDEIEALVQRCLRHGGRVSEKNNPDGSRSVYELNINYFDALSDPASAEPLERQAARFLALHAVLLALAGMPGIYVHSLLGSRSWRAGVAQTGHNRSINRQKFLLEEIERELAAPGLRRTVYAGLARMLRARAGAPAFHPYGHQTVLEAGNNVLAILRSDPNGSHGALCLTNLSADPQRVTLAPFPALRPGLWRDLLGGGSLDLTAAASAALGPYQTAWLVQDDAVL
jgi:sucrose phosphorylase